MSNCNYYHCGQPRACEHYGWCCGHRAGLATWLCEHMKPKEECHIKQPQEQPQEQPIEDNLEEPPLLLRAETLPYYLDKIEEYNEPQELIEQLAKSQTEYNSKIEAEMEEMRKKLAQYEEKKKIVDEIHQLEEKVKSLQPIQPEKKALPNLPKRTISIPSTTPRPVGQRPVLRTQKK